MPFDQAPQLHNPAAGFIFNANNAIVGPDQAAEFGRDWEETFRARRIQQFFDANRQAEPRYCRRRCRPTTSRSTSRDLLPFLKRVTPSDERARQALALLAAWNGVMDKDRPEPLIYTAFLRALHRIMLVEKTGLSTERERAVRRRDADRAAQRPSRMVRRAGQARSRTAARRSARALDEGLASWCKRDGADMSQWRWGHEHVALLQHKVYSHIPLLDRISDLEHALERRLLHARPRRRLRRARRPAVRAHPRRRLSRDLRSRRSRQVALHDRDRRVRPHLLAPLSRPGAAVDRRASRSRSPATKRR